MNKPITLTAEEVIDASASVSCCMSLLLAVIDDCESNTETAGYFGERVEELVKKAVRHLDHVSVALGDTPAGNFEEEFAALGPARSARGGAA